MVNVIIYHKNCMDGVSSAYLANRFLDEGNNMLVPLSYGKEDDLFEIRLYPTDVIYFVDFSLKRDKMIKLSKLVKKIIVIDHHTTAEEELVDLPENVEVNFNMKECGCTLTFDYFNNKKEFKYKELMPKIFDYIKDRDLWQWRLPDSKEVSEFLELEVIPNDVNSFANVLNYEIEDMIEMGKVLLKKKQNQIDSKINNCKVVSLCDEKFMIINATENISELGNEIILKHKHPALLYFISDNQVNFSLRSSKDFTDVSKIAKEFGGGGHRNAAGFSTDLTFLVQLLIGIKS